MFTLVDNLVFCVNLVLYIGADLLLKLVFLTKKRKKYTVLTKKKTTTTDDNTRNLTTRRFDYKSLSVEEKR